MDNFGFLSKWMSRLVGLFSRVIRAIWPPSPKEQRPPELWELEDKFNDGPETDPDKVKDRQFSNTIRSGRG